MVNVACRGRSKDTDVSNQYGAQMIIKSSFMRNGKTSRWRPKTTSLKSQRLGEGEDERGAWRAGLEQFSDAWRGRLPVSGDECCMCERKREREEVVLERDRSSPLLLLPFARGLPTIAASSDAASSSSDFSSCLKPAASSDAASPSVDFIKRIGRCSSSSRPIRGSKKNPRLPCSSSSRCCPSHVILLPSNGDASSDDDSRVPISLVLFCALKCLGFRQHVDADFWYKVWYEAALIPSFAMLNYTPMRHSAMPNSTSADVKKQTVFFLQTADVWSISSAAEACRCGPQTTDMFEEFRSSGLGGVGFFEAKTSAVCGPHLQPSAAEEVDQTSAVCKKKTSSNRVESISWTELKEVPVFVEKSGEIGGEIGGLNGRNRTRVLCCRRRDGVVSHQRRRRVAGLKTGDEQRPMVEKDWQQKRTGGEKRFEDIDPHLHQEEDAQTFHYPRVSEKQTSARPLRLRVICAVQTKVTPDNTI
ncbi:hypothetical protein LXL04_008862 [Taraxacum kok-saghyz]